MTKIKYPIQSLPRNLIKHEMLQRRSFQEHQNKFAIYFSTSFFPLCRIRRGIIPRELEQPPFLVSLPVPRIESTHAADIRRLDLSSSSYGRSFSHVCEMSSHDISPRRDWIFLRQYKYVVYVRTRDCFMPINTLSRP